MRTDPIIDKCFYIIGWLLIGAGLGVAAAWHLGALDFLGSLPHCFWHATTGLYCPGCGGTRALKALLKGKVFASLYYHPFVVYTVFLGGWFMLSQTVERITRGRVPIGLHYRDIYLWLALAIVVVNCLVKNLLLLVWGIPVMV